jgi:hypothetical protein
MGFLHHGDRDSEDATAPSEDDALAGTLAQFQPLAVADRATAILEALRSDLDAGGAKMDWLLSRWLVEPKDWTKVSDDFQTTWDTLKVILQEAFGLLVLARLLIRCEHSHSAMYSGATIVTYVISPDGRDALSRGDVAGVITRRLPD